MSWGYIVDLQVRAETKSYKALKKKKVAEFPLTPGWTSFKEAELVQAFAAAVDERLDERLTFAQALKAFEGVVKEDDDGEVTSLRVIALIDRSQLDQAGNLASLLIAAGEGTLSLVNDGTYSGDDGRELTVVKGRLVAKKLKNYDEKLEELLALLVPLIAGK